VRVRVRVDERVDRGRREAQKGGTLTTPRRHREREGGWGDRTGPEVEVVVTPYFADNE